MIENIDSENKKRDILAEIDQVQSGEKFESVFRQLDSYQIKPPSPQMTLQLIDRLKPVLAETIRETKPRFKEQLQNSIPKNGFVAALQLIRPQITLLSPGFVAVTSLVMTLGMFIAIQFGGDTLWFFANASPILGILTFLYEYRAKRYGVSEMEASCPFSPGQLASARLIVVLSYDILLFIILSLALAVYQEMVLWNIILNWLSPLVFILGVSLAASFSIGIRGGCIAGTVVWLLQVKFADGHFWLTAFLPHQAVTANIIGVFLGSLLLGYCFYHWQSATYWRDDVSAEDN